MLKKMAGNVIFGVLAVGIIYLVYLFITKGYSGANLSVTSILQNATPSATQKPTQETGSITSAKISLTITSPINGAILGSTNATVKGKTVPGAEVFVNDVEGKADANGDFSINIGLEEGENQIVVLVNDAEGNVSEQDINVVVSSFE